MADLFVPTEKGCAKPSFDVNNGHVITIEERKKVIVCNNGYHVNGSVFAHCDGTGWDRLLGTCSPALGDSMSCDFETGNICGWQSELSTSFEWKRRNGWVSFEQLDYGPKHDHTVMMVISFALRAYDKY